MSLLRSAGAALVFSALALGAPPAVAQDAPVAPAAPAESEASDAARAWEAWNAGEVERALELANAWLEKSQDDAQAFLLKGLAQDALGDHDSDNSLARARELGAKDPIVVAELVRLFVARYEALFGTDQDASAGAARSEAEGLLAAWSALAPGSAQPALALARLRKAEGAREEAIAILFAAIARDPQDDAPHTELWSFLGQELGYGELAAFYEGLARTATEPKVVARAWNYSGQVSAHSAEALAARARDTAVEAAANERATWTESARTALKRAIECMRLAGAADSELKDNSDWFAALYLVDIEKLHGDQGDLAATIDAAETARAALDPILRAHADDPKLRSAAEELAFAIFTAVGGESLANRDEPEAHERYLRAMNASKEIWKWATSIAPDSATWWNNLGFVAREAETYEESLAAYEKCIELAPENVRFLNDTALILLDYLHRDLDRALPIFEKAVALGEEQYPGTKDDPTSEADLRSAWGDAMLNLGKLHTERKDFAAADAAFDKLSRLDGGRPDLAEARARSLLARGDVTALGRLVDDVIAKLGSGGEGEDAPLYTALALRNAIARFGESGEPDAGDMERKSLLARLETALEPFRKKPPQ